MPSLDFLYSLRFRLLASLFILLGLSISVSLYGLMTFERKRYLDSAQAEAMRAGQTIEKALRNAMLANNREAIKQAVNEIHGIVKPSEISLLSFDGTIAVSSDDSLVGKHFDRNREASCMTCHTTKGLIPKKSAVFIETSAGPVLRNIIKIPNRPECYGCHAPEQKNCGVLIYDVFFNDTLVMLRTILLRTLLTGLVFFIFLIIALSFIIQRYVHRPLHQLMEGFNQIGQGNFNYWVEVDNKGEFQEMADQFNVMGHAINRSFIEIKKKNWETASLYTIVQQLSRAIEWSRLRRMVTELLYETFAVQHIIVCLAQEKKGQTIYEISWRQASNTRYHHREYALRIQSDGLPCDIMADWEKWQTGQLTSPCFSDTDTRVILPLNSKSVSLGLVCMQKEAGQRFNGAEKKLIGTVGEQISVALANARLYRMAITDALTELYTRRYCETVMRKFQESHASGLEADFCVLLLDIDHFKQVNDTYGHQVGDEVLVQLATLLKTHSRLDDVACRYGGEEFVMLVAGGLDMGRESALRLRQIIENYDFICSDAPILHNTVSIGVASFPLHGQNGEEIIGAADKALYQAKEQGRNRVICFGDTPA